MDGRSTIRLCLPDARIDLEAAAEAIPRAESSVAQHDWSRAWGPALTALFVAERGFLPGEDAPWIDEIRHQLTNLRLRALECYAAAGLPRRNQLNELPRDQLGVSPSPATRQLYQRLLTTT